MGPTEDALIVNEFESSIWPSGQPNLDEAWSAVYQMLMYYDDGVDLLHVNEVSALRKPAWRHRAELAETVIASALGISPPADLRKHVDRMMQLGRWEGMQRQNPVGYGYRVLVAEILRRWAGSGCVFLEEEKAKNWFPGIKMPGRSETPKIDIFITKDDVPRAILSCKWGIRHDRISDPTNECQEYRAAAAKRQIQPFEYYVMTNEFDGARLEKILEQPCVDGAIHTNVPLLRELTEPDRKLWTYTNLYDLRDFAVIVGDW